MQSLIDALHASERGTDTDGNPRYHADCPFCGKPYDPHQNHFYFSERGYKCWVCGENGGLISLANHLKMSAPTSYTKKPKPTKQKPPTFYSDALIKAYTSHPDRFRLWYKYRHLNEATVTRYHLGVGPLPGKSDGRLIVPIKKGGRWVGVRGRALNGAKPKWQTAKGTALQFYCPGGYRTDGTLWIVENMADALLLKQRFPEYDAGAPTGGALSWSRDWTDELAKRPPALLMLAFDNDDAGKAATSSRHTEFVRAGLNVEVFPWGDAPDGADIGAYLMGEYD